MMNDPLANIGQDDMAAQQGAPGEGLSHKKEIFDPMVHGVNLHRIERIRSVMGIAAGTIAGIIGLTGLDGLLFFLAFHLAVSLAIWAFKMKFKLSHYTKQSWAGFVFLSIQPTALSFTLFWTLFYGLVYLY